MTHELWWYTARASGLVSWALLSASMLWGLVLSTKLRPPRIRPNWTLDLHRYLGGLAVIFVGVHLAALVFDSYVGFGSPTSSCRSHPTGSRPRSPGV